jgi:predicted secreted Zn-dependent protease
MAIAAVALGVTAMPAGAQVTETYKREPYLVTGTTEDEVRADINSKRSSGFDATAKWYFRWRYTYRTGAPTCSFTQVSVALELTMVEPGLQSPDPVLRASFEDYLTKLRVHEEGHADIARVGAQRIYAALLPLTAATCDELGRLANETAKAVVAETDKEQKAYDAATNHGATQGALWPRRTGPPPPDRSQFQTSAPTPAPPSDD